MRTLESKYNFGDKVLFCTEKDNKPLNAIIAGISFTTSKVFYDLDLYIDDPENSFSQLRHVDAALVHEVR